jgi:hypothetical protein
MIYHFRFEPQQCLQSPRMLVNIVINIVYYWFTETQRAISNIFECKSHVVSLTADSNSGNIEATFC